MNNASMSLDHIREIALGREEKEIRHYYSDEEIAILREYFMEVYKNLTDEEENLLAIRKEFKIRMDKLRAELKLTHHGIHLKFKDEVMEVYLVPNFEERKMEYRDIVTGDVLDTRPLRPDEKQLNILQANAA